MQDHQKITLETYENHWKEYVEGTTSVVTGTQKQWLDDFHSKVEAGASILEIGSGSGRDADYFEEQGRHIYRTDVVQGFISFQESLGHKIHYYDVLSGPNANTFYGILAAAVFIHFDLDQFLIALKNVRDTLRPNGYFALTLKIGEGFEYTEAKVGSPRFFQYWSLEGARKTLEDSGFSIVSGILSDEHTWAHFIVQKDARVI
jgi:SAM-dependent methyltransferase